MCRTHRYATALWVTWLVLAPSAALAALMMLVCVNPEDMAMTFLQLLGLFGTVAALEHRTRLRHSRKRCGDCHPQHGQPAT